MSFDDGTNGVPLPIGKFAKIAQKVVKKDSLLQNQSLSGEISQWSVHNGNVYFTLRDNEGQMNCVIWRSSRLNIDKNIKSISGLLG